MDFTPAQWWFLIGVTLFIAEIFVNGFFVFWFGVSALFVSVLLYLGVISGLASSIFVWAVVGGLLAYIWFKAFEPKTKSSTLGDAGTAAIGRTGTISEDANGDKVAVFIEPLLGQRRWPIVESDVQAGDEVEVVQVASNRLKVKKTLKTSKD